MALLIPWENAGNSALASPSALATDSSIRQAVNGFATAWTGGDIRAIAGLFSERGVLVTPDGEASSRTEIVRFLSEKEEMLLRGKKLELLSMDISLKGERQARIDARYLLDGYTAMGFGSMPPGALTLDLEMVHNRWMVLKADFKR